MTYVVQGDVDLEVADRLEQELRVYAASTDGVVVVDCGAMTFIDSSGLRAFVVVANSLEPGSRTVQLVNVSPACARAFEITGLAGRFGISAS
jgi:anti-anti-sigma factor